GAPEQSRCTGGPAARAAADTVGTAQQCVDHQPGGWDDHAAPMPARCVNQVDGHRSPDTDHTSRYPLEKVMGPDGRDKPVDSQTPGLQVSDGYAGRAPRYRDESPRDSRDPGGGCEPPIDPRAGDARDQHALETTPRAEQPPVVVARAPRRMSRRAGGAQAPTVKAGPLDARVADVDEQHRHQPGLTVTSPEMKRRTPCAVSTSNAPCTSTPRARPCATPSPAVTSTGRPRRASAVRHSSMKGVRPSRSKARSPRRHSLTRAAATEFREACARPALARSVAAIPVSEILAKSAAPSAMFNPIPMTTQAGPADSARSSISTPPSLRSPSSRSLGHLSPAPATPSSRSARSAHTPMTRLSAPRSRGTSRNVQLGDRQIAPPGDASHARPRRPRPAVWYSARKTSLIAAGRVGPGRRPLFVRAGVPEGS